MPDEFLQELEQSLVHYAHEFEEWQAQNPPERWGWMLEGNMIKRTPESWFETDAAALAFVACRAPISHGYALALTLHALRIAVLHMRSGR